jgi:transposase
MVYLRKHLRKGNAYYSVVETFRENSKVRQRILHYIGSELEYNQFLQGAIGAKDFLSSDLENLLYQTPVSFWNLIKEMRLTEIISKKFSKKDHGVDAATAACAMVLNYATDRQNKCRFSDWYGQTYLPHILKIPAPKMNKDLLCRTMDCFTEENIYDIHTEVFKTANELYHLSDEQLFYDGTAVTFEGKNCTLAESGYNAAHSHNAQINIALATTKERFPVMHKVFDGGTKDVSTLVKVMPLLEKTGNLEKTIFIVDRGITSKANMDLVRAKKAKFIFGKPKDKKISALIASLKEEDFSKFDDKKKMDEAEEEILFCERPYGEDRLLIYWSKKLQTDNKKTREKRIKRLEEKLSKLSTSTKKYTEQERYEKIGVLCGKTYRKFFKIEFNEDKLTFSLKQDQIDLANKTEGRYAILTNTKLSPKEVLERYRDRNFVEMSFKDLKLFINIGPVHHWKDNRVLAHVFLAILAMAVRSILELKIRRTGLKITSEEALIQLNKVRALICKGKVLKITGQTEEIGRIVSAIEK